MLLSVLRENMHVTKKKRSWNACAHVEKHYDVTSILKVGLSLANLFETHIPSIDSFFNNLSQGGVWIYMDQPIFNQIQFSLHNLHHSGIPLADIQENSIGLLDNCMLHALSLHVDEQTFIFLKTYSFNLQKISLSVFRYLSRFFTQKSL